MGKYKFVKKVCSMLTAAVMVASMGVTGFAYTDGQGIKITNIGYAKSGTTDTLYEVTVDYTTSVTNNIGVTMLTYAKSGDKTLTESSTYGGGMQIVAIGQQAQASAGNGQFKFKVTTGNDNGVVKIEKDTPAVIRLGGDGVTAAAVGLLEIVTPKEVTVTSAKYDDTALSVNKYSYESDEDVVAKIKGLGSIGIGIYGSINNTDTKVATAQVDLANATSVTKNGDNYVVKGFKVDSNTSITKGDEYSNYTVNFPENAIDVADITVAVNSAKWEADTITKVGNFDLTISEGMTEDTIKAALKTKSVTVSDADNTKATKTFAITDAMIAAVEGNPTTFNENDVYKYTITVLADDDFTIANSTENTTFEVAVTLKAKSTTIVYGDADKDGDVTSFDASTILQYLVGSLDASEIDLVAADADGDNDVTSFDASTILQYLVGSINSLPYTE